MNSCTAEQTFAPPNSGEHSLRSPPLPVPAGRRCSAALRDPSSRLQCGDPSSRLLCGTPAPSCNAGPQLPAALRGPQLPAAMRDTSSLHWTRWGDSFEPCCCDPTVFLRKYLFWCKAHFGRFLRIGRILVTFSVALPLSFTKSLPPQDHNRSQSTAYPLGSHQVSCRHSS